MLNQYNDILLNCKIFSGVEIDELESLLKRSGVTIKSFRKGSVLIPAGVKLNQIIIVLEGKLKCINDSDSSAQNMIEILNPSDCFAMAYCITNQPSLATLLAAKKSTVMFLHLKQLLTLCQDSENGSFSVLQNLISVLANKVIILSQKIEYLSIRYMRARLSSFLLTCYYRKEENAFSLEINRTELSEYLNISRSAMIRELSQMQADGLIEFHGPNFKIINLEGLKINTMQ